MNGGAARLAAGGAARLVAPDVVYRASFLEALREYHAEGLHRELPLERLADPAEFARYVAALRADVERPGTRDRYILAQRGLGPPREPAGGYVPQTILWWVAGGRYLGRISIRHRLTAHLLAGGGNIGYEVRPSVRGRGHATAMLAAALPRAHGLGVDPAHIDCAAGNEASRRVIEKNGGRLERVERGSLYFVVPTGAGPAGGRPAGGRPAGGRPIGESGGRPPEAGGAGLGRAER